MIYVIFGIALVVVVGGAALVVFVARRMGKGEKRKRGRYTYSEKAQQAAGKSLVSETQKRPEKFELRPPPVGQDGTEELRGAASRVLGPLSILTKPVAVNIKGVDASKFGRNIKTAPMKIDRRFLKNAPPEKEEKVAEVEEIKPARPVPEAPKVEDIQEIQDIREGEEE